MATDLLSRVVERMIQAGEDEEAIDIVVRCCNQVWTPERWEALIDNLA